MATETIQITAPDMQTRRFHIKGTAPLCINRFSAKAVEAMAEAQKQGGQAKSRKKRDPKDFDLCFENAKHVAEDGWCGIAASAFRNAMISACRTVGFKMTHAKLAVFIVADGYDRIDNTPLVRIFAGEPEKWQAPARNANGGMDIRIRPLWKEWSAVVTIRFDAGLFSPTDITNLLSRVGLQVGIGEGRPDSRESAGIGFGTFELAKPPSE